MAVTTGIGSFETQRAYARMAGLFYLLVLVFDIAGLVITSTIAGGDGFAGAARNVSVSEGLYRIGLCLALLGSLSTIPLALGLYAALKPADGNLALMALLFRSAEATIGGVGIVGSFAVLQIYLAAQSPDALNAGQLQALSVLDPLGASSQVAAIFFSTGSTLFFYVFLRSRYIPRLMAAWGLGASVIYLAAWFLELAAPDTPRLVNLLASVPILIAEVSTGLWLLIAGVRPAGGAYATARTAPSASRSPAEESPGC
jgi:Domain of unknown function (DUF4386)